jgi:SulP family sulfate permease
MDRTTTSHRADARVKPHVFLQRYVPIAVWLPQYQRVWVRQDVIVGITLWGMIVLASALALVVGLILLLGGIWQMGFISDFLAKSVFTGFIFGLAITVAVGQVPKLLGLPREGETTPERVWYLLRHLDQANLWTLAIGSSALVLIAVVRRYAHRVGAGLVALVFGIIVVSWLNLDSVRRADRGRDSNRSAGAAGSDHQAGRSALPCHRGRRNRLSGRRRVDRQRARDRRPAPQQIDSNQELIALGAANVGASLLQGFSVDASLSTTATADEAGARTQLSSIITARLVLVTILALAPHPALDRVPPARGSNNSLHRTSSRTGAPTSMDMAKRALGGGV